MDTTHYFLYLGWAIAIGCFLGLGAAYIRRRIIEKIQAEVNRLNQRISTVYDSQAPLNYNNSQLINLLSERVTKLEEQMREHQEQKPKNYYNTEA